MTQNDKEKSGKPSTKQSGMGVKSSEKRTKSSPKFPPTIKTIGHGSGGVRTAKEVPTLPRAPGHGGGGIRPPKVDDVE